MIHKLHRKKPKANILRATLGKKPMIGYAFFIYVSLLLILMTAESTAPKEDEASISSFFDAFWYSIVTLTTVGYGDYYPVITTGKWIGIILVLASMGMLGILIGSLTTYVQGNFEKRRLGFMGTPG